jgi:hypothetical protein
MKQPTNTNFQQPLAIEPGDLSLKETELTLLRAVRSGHYEQIIIDFKDKKMAALSLLKQQDTHRKIVELLRESDFQEITIKSHQGKIVRLLNSIKIKFL